MPDPTTTIRFRRRSSAAGFRFRNFYADLDARLATLPFVAGDQVLAADITGLVTVDFATKAMSLPVPDEHKTLSRWVEKVSSRPSVAT